MSEVEDEIRRQMLAEREWAAQPVSPDTEIRPDAASLPADPVSAGTLRAPARRKGLAGAMATAGAALAKFWGVALALLGKLKFLLILLKLGTFGKLLLAGGSLLFSIWIWSFRFGWRFAAGFVMLIAIHECGHALAARLLGHKIGFMVFIPFCGGLVSTRASRNVTEGAFIGIMGPVVGTLASAACWLLFLTTGNPLWLALANAGFFINLINLAPSPPLDGGWLLPLFSPKLLLPCMVIGVLLFYRNPMFWVIALMSLPRVLYAWKQGSASSYYQATTASRVKYGLAWAALAAFLGFGTLVLPEMLTRLSHVAM